MIRPADMPDLPALVEMAGTLHAAVGVPAAFEPSVAAATLARLIAHPDGLVLVAEDAGAVVGFIAAEVVRLTVSRQSAAVEHGWFSRKPGWGKCLAAAYVGWAREKGCAFVRLSTPVDAPCLAASLRRAGFAPVEQAWVKAL